MSMVCAVFIATIGTMVFAKMGLVRHTRKPMKRFAGLMVSVGMLAGSATPAAQTPTTTPSSTTTTMTTTTTPEPEPEPAQVRQQVASMLMPGVVSYDDAKAKLEAGVGGIFITSWADPNLLTEPGRDIHALRA